MRSALVALLIAMPIAASAAAPEDAYIAARDAYTKKLEPLDKPNPNPAAASDDAFLKAQDAARADLEQQLRAIVGPVAVKGFSGAGKINLESLISGYEDFGKLDGLTFAGPDDKTQLVVTTTGLLDRWLKAHRKWWNDNNVPQRVDAALKSGSFYTQAIGNGAAVMPYVQLPMPAGGKPVAALLVARAQDIGPRAPDELIVSAMRGKRLYVLSTPAAAKMTMIPACEQLWTAALKKAEKMQNSDAGERVREAGDRALHTCFAERAKKESFFPAATRQAQDFLSRLPSQ
jgi:hypothetical protein